MKHTDLYALVLVGGLLYLAVYKSKGSYYGNRYPWMAQVKPTFPIPKMMGPGPVSNAPVSQSTYHGTTKAPTSKILPFKMTHYY